MLLELLATAFTIAFFSCNIFDALEYRKKRTTGLATAIPLLSTLVNCSLWLKYGLLKQEPTISAVNLYGLVISTICLYNFHHYSRLKEDVELKLATVLFFLDLFLVYVYYSDSNQVLTLLGFVNSGFSIIMFGSPLVSILQVLKLKHARGIISLPLSIAGLLVSTLWALLGIQMQDYFVLVPNVAGAVLSAIQVIICLWFRNSTGFLPVKAQNSNFNE